MAAVHPDLEALLVLIQGRPRLEQLAPDAARQAYVASRAILGMPPDDVASVQQLATAGGVPLRLYRAAGTAADATLPCLLFMHGGGWVLGDLASHDSVCRRLANESGGCVVAVDYRLAPEHPFPAPVEDAAAALAWVAGNAAALGIDPRRIAVGGDSAGGNLAAVLALMGRDGDVPASVFQLLFYPVTDIAAEAPSYATTRPDLPLTAASMRYFIDLYCPAPSRTDWRASPARAASLAGLPPALVVTCGHDPLCDEAHAYAAALEAAGARVTTLHLADHAHGFLTMGAKFAASHAVLAYAGTALRDAWRPG